LAGTGIHRNPEESGGIWGKYRNSCPTGIPAKKSCDSGKNRNSCDHLQNHLPVKNSSGKHRKKILRNPGRNRFFGPKNKFLKTGICNLGAHDTTSEWSIIHDETFEDAHHRTLQARKVDLSWYCFC
jgi:hypothetical protein